MNQNHRNDNNEELTRGVTLAGQMLDQNTLNTFVSRRIPGTEFVKSDVMHPISRDILSESSYGAGYTLVLRVDGKRPACICLAQVPRENNSCKHIFSARSKHQRR